MSQETSYNQIQRVEEINNYAESVAQIMRNTMRTMPIQVTSNVEKIKTVKNMFASSSSANILHSPTSLKVLQKRLNQNIAILNLDNTEQTDEVTKIKAAAIAMLEQENLRIENKELVEQVIEELLTANTIEQTTEKLSSAFAEIKREHAKVFTDTLSHAIMAASSTIGFDQVRLETVTPSLIRIVATNRKGINLISEIHTDASKKIDVLSELEGVTDGSCENIMDEFNAELEKRGIVAVRKERKSTGGIARLPYAKKLQKNRNTSKREFLNQQVIAKDNKRKVVQYVDD